MSKTSRYFEPLAIALAGGETIRSAAAAAGCSESTAYRICRSAELIERVSAIRTESTDAAVGKLAALASSAVSVLAEIMVDANVKPSDRISAAKSMLASLASMTELVELRRRLEAVEGNQRLRVTG